MTDRPHTIRVRLDTGDNLLLASSEWQVCVTPEGWLLVRALDGSETTTYPPHAIRSYTRSYQTPATKG